MLRGFLGGLAAHLEPGGEGWLILSDIAENLGLRSRAELLVAIERAGLRVAGRSENRGVAAVEIGIGEGGFQAADAAEVPGGVDELIEQVVLEGALGIEFSLVGGEEVVKLFLFAFADDQVAGGEAVFAGVLGGAGLALGGAGARGKTSVGGVRRLASWG